MKNKIIHYLLPTYDPAAFYKNVIGRIDLYIPLKDFISFGVNFQAPWTEEQILKVKSFFEANGLDFRYSFNSYTKEDYRFTLLQIREDCAKLNPTARYYCEIDDDIEYFCSSDTYVKLICNIIQYMEAYQVGACMIAKEGVKNCKNGYIIPLRSNTWTGFGLIRLNIHENGHLFPTWYTEKWGCNEDNLPAVFSLINGFETIIVGADIANHTFGYKNKANQSASKFGTQACRKLPGTNSHFIAYSWNRYLATKNKIGFYKLLAEHRPSNIPQVPIDYKTSLAAQILELTKLYTDKAMDIWMPIEKKCFNSYNLLNYNYTALSFDQLKSEVLDKLYLFKALSDFCTFSLVLPGISEEQLQIVLNIFYDIGITLYYSIGLGGQLNSTALIQKDFSTINLESTCTIIENTRNILIELGVKDIAIFDETIFNKASNEHLLTVDQEINLLLDFYEKKLLV